MWLEGNYGCKYLYLKSFHSNNPIFHFKKLLKKKKLKASRRKELVKITEYLYF